MDDFGNLFNESIEMLICEYRKKDNKEKIEKYILDPVVIYIGQQLWPYIITVSIFLCLMFILLFYIVYKMGHVKSSSTNA